MSRADSFGLAPFRPSLGTPFSISDPRDAERRHAQVVRALKAEPRAIPLADPNAELVSAAAVKRFQESGSEDDRRAADRWINAFRVDAMNAISKARQG